MSNLLLESVSGEAVGTILGLQGMSPEKKNETFLILGGLCALIALAAGAQLVHDSPCARVQDPDQLDRRRPVDR